MFTIKAALCFVLVAAANAGKLPSYMHQCSRSDKNINECLVKSANIAIPFVLKGDKNYHIPSLLPLEVNEIISEPGPNLKIVLNGVKIHGLEDCRIKEAKVDLAKQTLDLKVDIPRMVVLGDYEVKGQILILPITGKGPCNITIVDGIYDYSIKFDLKSAKDGKEHAIIVKDSIDYETSRTYYKLDNLFNGDKNLSDEMNKFLNDNWQDVNKDLKSGIGVTISTVASSILNSIFKTVPYDDIFIE